MTNAAQEGVSAKTYLKRYLQKHPHDFNPKSVAFYASLEAIAAKNPKIVQAILGELKAQRDCLKMIASENYSSLETQLAMGNLLTDKYSEGYVNHRFYAGCEFVDQVEQEAIDELKRLFGAEHAYVQPHSGADANLIAFWAVLNRRIESPMIQKMERKNIQQLSDEEFKELRKALNNQKILGMSLNSGGHLTHGYRMNVSAKMFEAHSYDVDPEIEEIDYDQLLKQAKQVKPLILIAGYSAYPKKINFRKMKEIAEEVDATLLVDMAHFSGLVAGKVFTGEFDPVPHADIVTSTTHKTLRGPRGGLILCKQEWKEFIDKGCPLVIGGPLPHVMAAKAVAFKEANTKEFQNYALQIVKNAKALAESLIQKGATLFGEGTENHLLVVNVTKSYGLTGKHAEAVLSACGITVNRNAVPFDPNGAWFTSGIRLGTPALTSRGLKEEQMRLIAQLIHEILQETKPALKEDGSQHRAKYELSKEKIAFFRSEITKITREFPLYPELDLDEE